jgi:YHS domain-containing protein
MNRTARFVFLSAAMALVAMAGPRTGRGSDDPAQPKPADDSQGRDIPAALAPFEYLVGRWKGQGMPKDNSAQQFRGWPESHAWAWIFTKGKPTGMSVAIEGGKVLAAGKLTYDADRKRYHLEGTEPKPGGGPIVFEGALDRLGKTLVLDEVGHAPSAGTHRGSLRLSVRPNSNFIRYTMGLDRKEPGAVQFRHAIEVGLTREGESFAAGSASGADRPKCIVTGGAATMTLTYQGRTFPICCTGCRDEFNESPEKYLKKAALIAASPGAKSKTDQPAPSRVSRFEDAFAGDVVDAPAMKEKRPSTGGAAKTKTAKAEPTSDADEAKTPGASKSASRKGTEKPAASQPFARAASLLRIGQNLEKSGKADAALGYYKRIVKDYADTPAAKTAKQRIKALDKS